MPVRFTVWSDILCPWCYVAAVRLHQVARTAGDDVAIAWRAFMLRPEEQPRDLAKFRHYAQSWHRCAEAEPGAEFHYWDGDAAPPSYSLPPLVATKVAATFGPDAFDAYHLALLRAYFVDNRTVSDTQVAVDVASTVGLDADEFALRLERDGPEHADAVITDHKAALGLGFAAVPTVVIGDDPSTGDILTGAMPVAAYLRVIRKGRGEDERRTYRAPPEPGPERPSERKMTE